MSRMGRITLTACLALLQWLASGAIAAERITVAVASNFLPTAREISAAFEADTGIEVWLTSASSGKLYAQITNGAPFDVFLSADAELPAKLEEAGLAVEGSRFTYAIGRLVLWSGDEALKDADCRTALEEDASSRLSVANPAFAPYGRAAASFLERTQLDVRYRERLVVGENISQAATFTVSGGARFGLLAAAQLPGLSADGCRWLVPANLHTPIEQQAVLLTRAADTVAAARFLRYLATDAADTIAAAGYLTSDD